MSHLTRKRLAHNLAQSLALTAWDNRALEACLIRRLPHALCRFAPFQARELLDMFPARFAPEPDRIVRMLMDSSLFERIHFYCERHNTWPAPDLAPPTMQPIAAFDRLDIPQLATLSDLADWLLLTHAQLDYYADRTGRHEEHGDMAVNHYHYHLTPKPRGGRRLIEAPKPRLKTIQRLILRAILGKVPPHADAFGFVPGRNCIDGAARHAGEAVVIAFDLRDFFNNISAGRVFGLFRCLGYPRNVAHALTGLCTVITPERVRAKMPFTARQMLRTAHLPQGAPTSPALANLVAHGLDRRLAGLAQSIGAGYSRYADDLTFSGDQSVRVVLQAVPVIVKDEGFSLRDAKTRVMAAKDRQRVTGLIVNDKVNVTRADFDRLKAVIHACHKPHDGRLSDPAFVAQLLGQIGWVEAVNPGRGARLRDLLAGQGVDA